MSRTLATAAASAVASESASFCHLIEFQFGGGTVNYTDAPQTITATCTGASASSWASIGGEIMLGGIEEGVEPGGYRMPIAISGVEQTFLNLLLSDTYLFRTCSVWRAYFTTSAVVANPIPVFSGKMTGRWSVREDRDVFGNRAGTVTISSELSDFFVDLDQSRGIQRNPESHNAAVGITGDTFYAFLPSLGSRVTYWGGSLLAGIYKGGGTVPSPQFPGRPANHGR